MPPRVLILDTSVLCCLLEVPGKETCGTRDDPWTRVRIETLLRKEAKSTLVLPLATIIETGNHIAQAPHNRFVLATKLAEYLSAIADGTSPWAAFTEQAALWSSDGLKKLATEWPHLASGKTSIGDATIKDVAEYYAKLNCDVEIVTGDAGLKAYEPISKPMVPRRRRPMG